MPQMSPINWMLTMTFIPITILSSMFSQFWSKAYTPNSHNKKIFINKLNWMW